MNTKLNVPQTRFDSLKWGLVALLLVLGVIANYHFMQTVVAIRLIGWLVLGILVLSIAAFTRQGYRARGFLQEAKVELRKVVWPTRQETLQTTLIVAVIVVVMGLLLWGCDSFLLWLMGWLTGQRG